MIVALSPVDVVRVQLQCMRDGHCVRLPYCECDLWNRDPIKFPVVTPSHLRANVPDFIVRFAAHEIISGAKRGTSHFHQPIVVLSYSMIFTGSTGHPLCQSAEWLWIHCEMPPEIFSSYNLRSDRSLVATKQSISAASPTTELMNPGSLRPATPYSCF